MEIDKRIFDKYNIKMEEIAPKIIDAVVSVYGEENRDLIEDRLKRIYINSYATYDQMKTNWYQKKNRKERLLGIKFLREIGMEISDKVEDEVYKNGCLRPYRKCVSSPRIGLQDFLCRNLDRRFFVNALECLCFDGLQFRAFYGSIVEVCKSI